VAFLCVLSPFSPSPCISGFSTSPQVRVVPLDTKNDRHLGLIPVSFVVVRIDFPDAAWIPSLYFLGYVVFLVFFFCCGFVTFWPSFVTKKSFSLPRFKPFVSLYSLEPMPQPV